jgi:hypothetical protein
MWRGSERPLFSERDRGFESGFLQRRVVQTIGSYAAEQHLRHPGAVARLALSYRDVEELLAERGLDISCELLGAAAGGVSRGVPAPGWLCGQRVG